MRLLPNRVRVAIVERTPVAFVRQGNEIGLVDAHGILLDMSPDADAMQKYSFPVLTGISANDPALVRASRMKLYGRFTSDLDSGADKVSKKLSEVDLSDPKDVKALIGGESVLVHFGEEHFLARYQRFEENLAEWKTKYPKLASADMQYPEQVVLEMAPGTTVEVADTKSVGVTIPVAGAKSANKPVAKAAMKAKLVAQGHAKAVPVKRARGPR